MASLGDQLLSPEAGWQRISITSDVITKSTPGTAVNGYWYWVVDNNLKIQFNFRGSKIRIIAPTYYDRVVMRVMIDGKEYFSLGSTIEQYVIILFEKTLAKREHYVQITPVMGAGTYLTINGFDIDATGEILPYREIENYQIYLKDGLGYGVQDSTFTKLTDNWESLTPADKKALFLSTNCDIASATELVNLGKIREIIYSETDDRQSVAVIATPKDQLVMPKGLISMDSFEGIDKATLTCDVKTPKINMQGRLWENHGVTCREGRFKNGRSLYFNGASYLELPANSDCDFGTEEFTIAFWIKGVAASYPTIIGLKNNSLLKFSAAFNGGNPFIQWSGADYYTATQPILDGEWNYVELIREKGVFELYKNCENILRIENIAAKEFNLGTTGTQIGTSEVGNSFLTAQIDDFYIVKGEAIRQTTIPNDYISPVLVPDCKLIVTTDLTTYQTYDFTAQEWKAVDHADLAEVKANGIDVFQLPNITREAWDALTTDKAGIGFAYLLSIEDITDTCSIDKLDLQVDMRGSWDKAIHGTDYKYGYPANTALRVSLISNGDYKINYSK